MTGTREKGIHIKVIFLTFLLSCTALLVQAQQRCGTQEFLEYQKKFRKNTERVEQFEEWMSDKRELRKQAFDAAVQSLSTQNVLQIPVVVHVIHNGESIGQRVNIPDEQILSQIQVLNEDFRRQNADAVNTPDMFLPIAGDAQIEFVMAKQDPEGLPTDGIVRADGGKTVWQLTDNYAMKNVSYWPAEDYLNIYVVDLENAFLGYAQFPESSLQGLENASENPFTDGIIVDYRAFGSRIIFPGADLFAQYDLGRTATHEVGHFLGLRHIWGDGGCEADDFVTDTPLQGSSSSNLGEPCTFPGPNTCDSGPGDLPDMFQNYMDYSDDACLNIFTLEQIDRMRIVMDNSPRRLSLITSPGLLDPVIVANDAGVRNILTPSEFACPDPFSPVVEIRNYGNTSISNVEIAMSVDIQERTRNIYPIALDPGEIGTLVLPQVLLDAPGELNIEITSVNGMTDGNDLNNRRSKEFIVSDQISTSFTENFAQLPDNWDVVNPDGLFTWQIASAPSNTPGNRALFVNFFDYENFGEIDLFVSPLIDLENATNALLTFDVAYSGFSGFSSDGEGLLITITDDCASPLFASDTIYLKTDQELRTASPTSVSFQPTSANDWRTEVINLLPYLGRKIRLSFTSINGYGNNLYIDNIGIDLGNALSLSTPEYIFCETDIPLGVELTNTLGETITSFDIEVNIDRSSQTVFSWTGSLPADQSIELVGTIDALDNGFHLLEVEIANVNNGNLNFGSDGEATRRIHVNSNTVETPFRQDFEDYQFTDPDAWVTVSQGSSVGYELSSTGFGNSIGILNQNNNSIGDVDVMASPLFSLRNTTTAFLQFDLAYKQYNTIGDIFEIRLSRDCGITYDTELFRRSGADWPFNDFNGQDIPVTPSDWEKITLDLTAYAGEQDLRLGFFTTNANGGSLFLDNFEFFVSQPVVAENGTIFPNPVGPDGMVNVTFNVPDSEDIEIRIINSMGQVLVVEEYSNVLNQTLPVNMGERSPGVYIIQVTGETFSFSKRIVHGIF